MGVSTEIGELLQIFRFNNFVKALNIVVNVIFFFSLFP